MNEVLIKRFKSLLWRLGGVVGVGLLGFFISPEVASTLGLPAFITVFGGLVVGEITKWLNSG